MTDSFRNAEALRARYRASSDAVARVQAEELFELTEDEALRRTLSLRLFRGEVARATSSSGLVDQQACFRRQKP